MQKAVPIIKRAVYITVAVIVLLALNTCSMIFDDDDDNTNNEVTIVDIKKTGPLNTTTWLEILLEIDRQNSLVNLDLSECTLSPGNRSDGLVRKEEVFEGTNRYSRYRVYFDPNPYITLGKNKIVSLILPDIAEKIEAGEGSYYRKGALGTIEYGKVEFEIDVPAFNHFTRLKSVKGARIKQIGRYAFAGLKSLEQVEFPNVTHAIGEYELVTGWTIIVNDSPYGDSNPIDGWYERDIDYAAFMDCTALKDVKIENAMIISIAAFKGCTSLRSINFPSAWLLHQHAFEGCTGLTEVTLPSATKIGNFAFAGCTRLTKAAFPKSTAEAALADLPVPSLPYGECGNIGDGLGKDQDKYYKYSIVIFDGAFSGCSSLQTLEIRNAWNVHFGALAFEKVGKTLDIHLSDSRHSLNNGLSFGEDNLYSGVFRSTTITLETINLHGLSPENFDIIKNGVPPGGPGDGLDNIIPRLDPDSPRINLVPIPK
ncbi:MAG: leucine-rich repeat domain-containing protein [Spirochaetaceae bacterium]|jgi:hypothetical protein|nr:leucine-rich repeat domain-containing protein [Spirochaetaceae bacterium]